MFAGQYAESFVRYPGHHISQGRGEIDTGLYEGEAQLVITLTESFIFTRRGNATLLQFSANSLFLFVPACSKAPLQSREQQIFLHQVNNIHLKY